MLSIKKGKRSSICHNNEIELEDGTASLLVATRYFHHDHMHDNQRDGVDELVAESANTRQPTDIPHVHSL